MKYLFSKNFSFGVSDADLQVIGEDFTQRFEQSEPTMWESFGKTSGKVFQNQTPGVGINRFEKWQEDIEIIKQMDIKEYRTSISMSRTLHKNGDINGKAIEWYRNYFKELKANGVRIYATLYHWELPYFLQEKGGWLSPETINWFLNHVDVVTQYLGEYINEYFILNEPWCSSIVAYYFGEHAPGEQNLSHALQAAHNLLLAQGLAYKKLYKINSQLKISTVVNVDAAYPASNSTKDLEAARHCDGFFNRWFLDPVFLGEYPEDMMELYGKHVPNFSSEDMKLIHIGENLHSLGINYYRGSIVRQNLKKDLGFERIDNPNGEKSDLGWPIYLSPYYPEGLFDILERLYERYKNHGLKKLYITENGVALKTPWDGKEEIINDEKRIRFIQGHLIQVHKAIEMGIPVKKYFTWSLMDSYEWSDGYKPEASFGLIHIERPSLKRVWKKSALWYKKLIHSRILMTLDRR